jgi:hypothetical protein
MIQKDNSNDYKNKGLFLRKDDKKLKVEIR